MVPCTLTSIRPVMRQMNANILHLLDLGTLVFLPGKRLWRTPTSAQM